MLNFATLLANMISEFEDHGTPVRTSLAVPSNFDFKHIHQLSPAVNLLRFELTPIARSDARLSHIPDCMTGAPQVCTAYTYPAATDGKLDILLADVWIVLTGLFAYGPLVPLKPYIVYAPDFIQRVVPDIFGLEDGNSAGWNLHAFQIFTLQQCQAVMVTSHKTGLDAVSYAGVPKNKVHVFPMASAPLFTQNQYPNASAHKADRLREYLSHDISPPSANNREVQNLPARGVSDAPEPYFLWVTNSTQHKNHRRALEALSIYYNNLGGKLRCIMCGPLTEYFDPSKAEIVSTSHPYHVEIREVIRESKNMNGNLIIAGEVTHGEFREYLGAAAFLWHNVLYDNGTFSVIEAAALGTRSLVSRYPQMVEICDVMGINARTFDPWKADATAQALSDMEDALVSEGVEATLRPVDLKSPFKEKLRGLLQAITFNQNRHGRREEAE